jgi:hypothetical protein
MTTKTRASFIVTLVPKPGVDAIKSLRAVLKYAARAHGLRCTEAREQRVGEILDGTNNSNGGRQ